jgi:PAS domain S-box-containing protein
VSWKLYDPDGRPIRHDECPMAVALKEARIVRGGQAIAERPDGRRIAFLAFPTPLMDAGGRLHGGVNMLVDISARKEAELALLQSEERYRRLVSLMPSALYTCEAPSGRITFYNQRAAELWGRAPRLGDSEERFCGSFRLWRPDGSLLPHDQTPMALALREGRSFRNLDVVVERPDGSRASILVNIDPIRDAAGGVTGAINVFNDVTALKHAERELVRRTEHLGAFLDTAAIALHRVAEDGTILWANEAELRMLGYSADEYIGQHIARFHADPENIHDILACLTRGERLREREARLRCKDGSIKTVLIDSSVLREDGRFLHTQCFTRDITERKKAEELRARLAWIVDSSNDAIIGTSLDGTINSWNRAAERLFGYTSLEAIGSSIFLIIPESHRPEEEDVLARLARGERIEHFETERRAKDGRRIAISLTVSPVRDSEGRIVGVSKVGRDITDRRRIEAERREAERRKDDFLAILSHELRNPLAPLRNAAHLLKTCGDDAALRQRLEGIMDRQLGQMTNLVDQLMDLTRISRGIVTPQMQQLDVAEAVSAAIETVRPLIDEHEHRLRVSLPSERLLLEADPLRFSQILVNLLSNAAKYTPRSGSIFLEAANSEGWLEVRVRDSGIGIEPERIAGIFDMFTPASGSHLSGKSGLGIGLSIARGLARLHGGDIEAKSGGAGKGSEFILRLPVRRGAIEKAAEAVVAEAANEQPLRVLIADDNVDAAETTRLLLERRGCAVRVVHDGQAAVDQAIADRPDVLLLDLGMPGLDGFAVARKLRDDSNLRHVRIVALTGHGLESFRRRTAEAGFDAHLVKPVDPATLTEVLRRTAG